jgi:hypothetical protein
MYDLLVSCGYENSIKVEEDIQIKKIPVVQKKIVLHLPNGVKNNLKKKNEISNKVILLLI